MDATVTKKTLINIFIAVVIVALFSLLFIFVASNSKKKDISNYYIDEILHNDHVKLTVLNTFTREKDVNFFEGENNAFTIDIGLKNTDTGDPLYVNILSSYFSYTISVEDEMIFEKKPEKNSLVASGATSFDFIKIPYKYIGHTAKIKFVPNINKRINQNRPEIYLGSEGINNINTLRRDLFNLLFFVLTFIVGFVLSIIGLIYIFLDFKDNDFFSIGLFSLLISLYIFSQIDTAYILIENNIAIYFIEYISASYLCVPIIFIMAKKMSGNKKKVYNYIYYFMSINICFQAVVSFFGISEFIVFREFTMLMVLLQVIFIFNSLGFGKKGGYISGLENVEDKIFYASITLLALIFSIAMILYMFIPDFPFMILIAIGMLIFLSLNLGMAINRYVRDYRNFVESNLLKRRAMFDNLTKLGSRYSFEIKMKSLKKNRKYKNVFFCLIDINSLKHINDYYGHHKGDKVIRTMAEVISKVRNNNKRTEAYRIGGDEFVFLAYNLNEEKAESIVKSLREVGEEYRDTKEDCLSFALGYTIAELDDKFSKDNLMEVVDEKMYDDKNNKI